MRKKLVYGENCSILEGIDSPIEQRRYSGKGEAWAVKKRYVVLNNRQLRLLDKLPGFDSRVTVTKSHVSMSDLAALTADTGVEFAMFTCGHRRLIVRGDRFHVNINPSDAAEMRARGYRWSGHTHVVGLIDSKGDRAVLEAFGQNRSTVYNAMGQNRDFFSN